MRTPREPRQIDIREFFIRFLVTHTHTLFVVSLFRHFTLIRQTDRLTIADLSAQYPDLAHIINQPNTHPSHTRHEPQTPHASPTPEPTCSYRCEVRGANHRTQNAIILISKFFVL